MEKTNNILNILQACCTLKEISLELNKKFGWIHFIQKKKYNDLKSKLKEQIKNLKNDEWDSSYIKTMEIIFLSFYKELNPYMDDIYIPDYDENNPSLNFIYKPMTFFNRDLVSDSTSIINIDIINDSINIVLYNTLHSEYIKCASEYTIHSDYRYIEDICKSKVITMLLNYIDGVTNDPIKNQNLLLMEQIKKEYPLEFFEPDIIVPPLPDEESIANKQKFQGTSVIDHD
jgi:hypothetical protein